MSYSIELKTFILPENTLSSHFSVALSAPFDHHIHPLEQRQKLHARQGAFVVTDAAQRGKLALLQALAPNAVSAFLEGERFDLCRPPVDEGEPMRALLRKAYSRGVSKEYVSRLLEAFIPRQTRPKPTSQLLVEPLTERELDVLKLLRTELTGPEIAQELSVSLNTMRTHTKNIYSKLDVNNRRGAIHRAEELNLI